MTLAATIFAVLVAYLPSAMDPATAGRWAVLACCASVMLLRMPERPLLGRGHFWGLALLAWAAASALWSASPLDTAGALVQWISLAVLFVWASQERHDHELAIGAMVLGLAPSLAIATFERKHGVSVLSYGDGPAGLFVNRNTMGELAACALIWAAASRMWLFVPLPLVLVGISGSRGAILACACGGLYVLWRSGRRAWTALAAAVFASASIGYSVATHYTESWLIRAEIWIFAIYNLTWTGHGLDTFATLAPGFGYVHNDYVQLGFELGAGALLVAPLLWRALGPHSGPEGAALASLLGAAIVSYPMHHPAGAALIAILAGMCCGAADRGERALRLCGLVGATRSEYERREDPAGEIPLPRPRLAVVASRSEYPVGSRDVASSIQQASGG